MFCSWLVLLVSIANKAFRFDFAWRFRFLYWLSLRIGLGFLCCLAFCLASLIAFPYWALCSWNYLCAMIGENVLILDDFTRCCLICPSFCCSSFSVSVQLCVCILYYNLRDCAVVVVCCILIYSITKENLWQASRNQLKLLLIIMRN